MINKSDRQCSRSGDKLRCTRCSLPELAKSWATVGRLTASSRHAVQTTTAATTVILWTQRMSYYHDKKSRPFSSPPVLMKRDFSTMSCDQTRSVTSYPVTRFLADDHSAFHFIRHEQLSVRRRLYSKPTPALRKHWRRIYYSVHITHS